MDIELESFDHDPVTRSEHIYRWHGGNFQNDTFGKPLNLEYPEDF